MLLRTAKTLSKKINGVAYLLFVATLIGSIIPASSLAQEPLRMVIQPFQTEEKTRELFQPLVDYLELVSGQKIKLITYPNFISYWSVTQKSDSYDIAFDAAHFVDYRDKNKNFTVLAKQPGLISISLIVSEDSLVFDADELIGKKIATLGPPSIAAVRINEMFDNPIRQPTIIEGDNSTTVMSQLVNGEVDAAMLPTPIVSARMSGEGGISMVTTTDTIPGLAISVSPTISADIKRKITKGLLEAGKTAEGKKMLEKTKLNEFEKTSSQDFSGFAELLDVF